MPSGERSTADSAKQPEPVGGWRKVLTWLVVTLPLLLPRILLAGAGIAALVVGLKAAWNADAATAALVIAAVLLGLAAVLAPDLEELSGWFRGGGLRYRRSPAAGAADAYAQVSQRLDAALQEKGESGLRSRIEEIASESTKAAVQEALQAERETGERRPGVLRELTALRPGARRGAWSSLIANLTAPSASHTIENGRIVLRLTNPPANSATCTVRTPQGPNPTKFVAKLGEARVGDSLEVVYPTEFPTAPTLVPGGYRVEWFALGPQLVEGRLQYVPGGLIAIDEFEIPDDEATRKAVE